MKMSEEFNLPTSYHMSIDGYGEVIFDLTESQTAAAAHAINVHDKLVEALDYMIKLNEKMIREFNGRVEPWYQLDEEHLHDASVLLAKAEG